MLRHYNKDAFKKAYITEKKLRFGRGWLFALLFIASVFVLPSAVFAANSVFTDMYVISYNQGASEAAQKIYSQMLSNMFFNAGTEANGGLDDSPLGYCSDGTATEDNLCYTDIDCEKRGAGYCESTKARVTRDTIRLGDLQDIQALLQAYYSKLRCSNDYSRSCKTNADCYGGGACGNFRPKLTSGTYITGKTNSAWPSWQATLGKDLGATLPVDPINKLFTTMNGAAAACSDPYSSSTCWDATGRSMPLSSTDCKINEKTAVYQYISPQNNVSAKMYIKGELDSNGNMWQPAWTKIPNLNYNPFIGYAPGGMCSSIKDTCGNGILNNDEDCSTCPQDAGCGKGQKCTKDASGAWYCATATTCGDGSIQPGEECDLGPFNTTLTYGCTPISCQCADYWDCSNPTNPSTVCGDAHKLGTEQCDLGTGINGTAGSGCNADCSCESGNDCTGSTPVKLCGNGISIDAGEQCDLGTARNGQTNEGCDTNCQCVSGWTCVPGSEPVKTCGNGVIDGSEVCDNGSAMNGVADSGCNSDCTCESGYVCHHNSSDPTTYNTQDPICGDGILKGTEQCDFTGTTPTIGCTVADCCNLPGTTNQCKYSDSYSHTLTCSINYFTVNGVPASGNTISVSTADVVSIAWNVSGSSPAVSVSAPGIVGVDGNTNLAGNYSTTLTAGTKTVSLTACGETRTVTINVSAVAPTCAVSLWANTYSITAGGSVTLSWSATSGSNVKLSTDSGYTRSSSGSQSFTLASAGNVSYYAQAQCGATIATSPTIVITVSTGGTPASCGDAVINGFDICDCGAGTYHSADQIAGGIIYSCSILQNFDSLPASASLPWTLTAKTYNFCNTSCGPGYAQTGQYCGDGIITTGYETCDKLIANNNGYCSASCQKTIASAVCSTLGCYVIGDGICSSSAGEPATSADCGIDCTGVGWTCTGATPGVCSTSGACPRTRPLTAVASDTKGAACDAVRNAITKPSCGTQPCASNGDGCCDTGETWVTEPGLCGLKVGTPFALKRIGPVDQAVWEGFNHINKQVCTALDTSGHYLTTDSNSWITADLTCSASALTKSWMSVSSFVSGGADSVLNYGDEVYIKHTNTARNINIWDGLTQQHFQVDGNGSVRTFIVCKTKTDCSSGNIVKPGDYAYLKSKDGNSRVGLISYYPRNAYCGVSCLNNDFIVEVDHQADPSVTQFVFTAQ